MTYAVPSFGNQDIYSHISYHQQEVPLLNTSNERANYQTFVWKNALEANPTVHDPSGV